MSHSTRQTVLVVEDEGDLRQLVADSLDGEGFAVAQSFDAADAIERLRGFAYDAVVVDLRLPDADGMDVLEEALTLYPEIRAVVMTGFGGVAEAVGAMKKGAIDFLIKPFELAQLAQILQRAFERPDQEIADAGARPSDAFRLGHIIGRSQAMRDIFATVELVSPMKSTVLIHGETGTGKELIARTIHQNSPRSDQQFVAFNAAALPEGLVEAELFGHTKGAFTGAVQQRIGRFELAHRGTLFIDEVSSMSPSLQAKLLRALQERQVERIGESRPVPCDIRVIAATNLDLRKLVKEGAFREDLFYRLNVVTLGLPPLRSRREDLPLLVQHFLIKSCEANGLERKTIAQDAMRALMIHPWPGNIRQLENAIEHAVAMSGRAAEVTYHMLPLDIREPEPSTLLPGVSIPDEGINFMSVVSQLERELILKCLEKTRGNKRQAARLLNLSRTTLIDKLHRLNASADQPAA